MKNKMIITSAALSLTAIFSATPVLAKVEYASDLGVYPQCSGCHATTDNTSGDGGNSRNQLRGSKSWQCTPPQVLNATKDLCVIPPAIPTCTGNTVLNVTKDACIAKDVISPPPVTPPATQNETFATTNTNPVLNKVATQWDAKVGKAFKIPLSVKDAEQDSFMMLGSVTGSKFSTVHADAAGLPSMDFLWTPTASQVNKIYTITFQAKETKTTQKFVSNKVSVKIRVWAAGDKSAASITKLNVVTSAWKLGKLNLAGNVVFNNLLTTAERKTFIAQKLDLIIKGSDGALIGAKALTLNATNGNWSVSLPVTQAPCDIILEFAGQKAARTVAGITGCVKPAAAAKTAILAKNDENNEHEDNEEHDD